MCVAQPGRIHSIGEPNGISIPAEVHFGDRRHTIDLALIPNAGVGDWIIAHSGYAIRLTDRPRTAPPASSGQAGQRADR